MDREKKKKPESITISDKIIVVMFTKGNKWKLIPIRDCRSG